MAKRRKNLVHKAWLRTGLQIDDEMTPIVSIVVASMRCGGPLKNLLDSIKKFTPDIYEIVLVTPALPVYLGKSILEYNEFVRIIEEPEPRGCVHAFNLGFVAARGKFVAHLNDDVEVTEGWLTSMLDFVGDGDCQGVFYIKEPDTNGFIVNYLFGKLYGNFSLIKKSLMEELGYWDEKTFEHYGADPDFSLRVHRAGYIVAALPTAKIIHHCINDSVRKEHLRSDAGTKLQQKWRGIYYHG